MRRYKYPNYLWDGQDKISECYDLMEWSNAMTEMRKAGKLHIADETLPGDIRVSTVFLGLDHQFPHGEGPPLVFETLVFRGPLDGEMDRYATAAAAREGHKVMTERVRNAVAAEYGAKHA